MQLVNKLHAVEGFPGLAHTAVFRTDLITPASIGNKHFKLSRWLARSTGRSVLTFGGAWSNHLHAFALLSRSAGCGRLAVVRGRELVDSSNALLRFVSASGVQLHFVSRREYQHRSDPDYQRYLMQKLDADTLLPEGGSSSSAVDGCQILMRQVNRVAETPPCVAVAVGTGATFAGLIAASRPEQQLLGVNVSGDSRVESRVAGWLKAAAIVRRNWELVEPAEYRYGQPSTEILRLLLTIHCKSGVAFDPIYAGPLLQYLGGAAAPRSTLVIHSGGLSGAYGQYRRFLAASDKASVASYFATIQRQGAALTRAGSNCGQ